MEPHDRLRQAREAAGYDSPIEASRRFGWSEHTYKSHENGIRGIRPAQAHKYAKAFKVSAGWILTGEGIKPPNEKFAWGDVISVPVLSPAAGGVWREGEDTQMLQAPTIPVIPDPRFPVTSQYSRRVEGNSVSNRIKHDEYAIMVRFESYPGTIPANTLVDVTRTRSGFVEHSIKVLAGNDLWTDSAELDKQEKLELSNSDDDTVVSICGIAIGVFRPL